MRKIIGSIIKIITLIIFILLAVLLTFKIKDDVLSIRTKTELDFNTKNEAENHIQEVEKTIKDIKYSIEKDIGQVVEVADVGSIGSMDIFFVTNVDNQYKYITKLIDNETEVFAIAKEEDGRYIVSDKVLKLDDLVFTNIDSYIIDKDGNVTYLY